MKVWKSPSFTWSFTELRSDITGKLVRYLVEDGAEVEAEHFARLRHVLTELVFFCSLSDNTDPMTREGLPQEANQSILCELLVGISQRLLDGGRAEPHLILFEGADGVSFLYVGHGRLPDVLVAFG